MATDSKRPLRPLRVPRTGDHSPTADSVPLVPERIPESRLASDRSSTEASGLVPEPLRELYLYVEPDDLEGMKLLLAFIDHMIERARQ